MINEAAFDISDIKKALFGYSKESIEKKLTYIQNEYNKLVSSYDSLSEEIEELQNSLYEKNREYTKLEQINNELEDDLEFCKNQISELKQNLEELNQFQQSNEEIPISEEVPISEEIPTKMDNSNFSLKNEDEDEDDEDILVGEIETNKPIVNESFMIGDNDNDENIDFEFL